MIPNNSIIESKAVNIALVHGSTPLVQSPAWVLNDEQGLPESMLIWSCTQRNTAMMKIRMGFIASGLVRVKKIKNWRAL